MKLVYSFIFWVMFIVISTPNLQSQTLKGGFDKSELKEMMLIGAITCKLDSNYNAGIPEPEQFQLRYKSAPMAMDNLWELWISENHQAVISIRGSTAKTESWISNIYAAMAPATGILQLSQTDTFKYQLAENPLAAVHVGWLLSLAYLSRDIMPRMDSLYQLGYRDFYITGHSQGGAISFLFTSYLHQLQKQGKIPVDIRFKTYCSAAPKPGNLYFAQEYEAAGQLLWAFNVVNSADWVPETPISIQTLSNFNLINPFANIEEIIHNQKLPKRMAMKFIYKRLSKPTRKAQKKYEKYLGNRVSKLVLKYLPDFIPPKYVTSFNYERVGVTVILTPDSKYYKRFPNDGKDLFINHFHKPYLMLVDQI